MTSSVFTKINSVLDAIDGFVWGLPLIILILATGIFLTIRLRGVQFSQLKFAIKSMGGGQRDPRAVPHCSAIHGQQAGGLFLRH